MEEIMKANEKKQRMRFLMTGLLFLWAAVLLPFGAQPLKAAEQQEFIVGFDAEFPQIGRAHV